MNRNEKNSASSSAPHFVYLVETPGHRFSQVHEGTGTLTRRIRSQQELVAAFDTADRDAVWVTAKSDALSPLATHFVTSRGEQRLLVLDDVKDVVNHVFTSLFRYVVSATDRIKLLPFDELMEVLVAPNRKDLFIGGAVDQERGVVVLYRGNVEPLVIPLVWFANTSSSAVPNANAFAVTDYGQTIKLGEFEAAADAILYEFDADFRRAAKLRALAVDDSVGSAIRRLRLQRGLGRGDFPGITEKTIARIERNEIAAPRVSTMEKIALVLGVRVSELGTY